MNAEFLRCGACNKLIIWGHLRGPGGLYKICWRCGGSASIFLPQDFEEVYNEDPGAWPPDQWPDCMMK